MSQMAAQSKTSNNAALDLNLPQLVQCSLDRLRDDLKHCPVASEVFWRRAKELGANAPQNLFLNPLSTPVLLFPLWIEQSLSDRPDVEFQYELAYASINLLYYVRLLDDAMDGHVNSAHLLPLLTSLHARFQGELQKLFAPDDRFWKYFFKLIEFSTEVTVADFSTDNFTPAEFMEFAAQKSCCALIPIAAVLCRYRQDERFERWSRMWIAFSAWNQMRDDISDWFADFQNNINSYLLSEARRLKRHDEDVPQWMLREGYEWSMGVLHKFATEARELAGKLEVPEMQMDLDERYRQVEREFRFICNTLTRIETEMKRVVGNGA
jgi:hypothetical protein